MSEAKSIFFFTRAAAAALFPMADLLNTLRSTLRSWSWWPGVGVRAESTPSLAFPDVRAPTAADAGWSKAASAALFSTLNVPTFSAAQDVVNALTMAEIAYTITESGPQVALAALRSARASFPSGLCTVGAIQATCPHVSHSYLLGSAPGALFVAFAGTQAARDVVTDVDIRQTEVYLGLGGEGGGSAAAAAAVHRGFLARARGVPVALLAAHAAAHGRRLVLCGHSLGGAVATMSALNLLRREADGGGGGGGGGTAAGEVSCVTFAAPALGNAQLAALVASRRWNDRFYNLTFPDDAVPRLLASTPTALAAADAAAQADKQTAPPMPPDAASISHGPFGGGRAGGEATPSSSSKRTSWVPPIPSVPPAVARAAAAVGEAATAALPTVAWSAALPDMPSYAHFGQHHTPHVPRGTLVKAAEITEDRDGGGRAEETASTTGAVGLQARLAALAAALPASVAGLGLSDALTRVPGLAAHRVATYRDRLRMLVRSVPGAPTAWPVGASPPPPPSLSGDVAPPLALSAARARLPPLPPPPPPNDESGARSYWATVRRTAVDLAQRAAAARVRPGAAATAATALSLTILVRGRGLASASGARVGLPPAAWFPAAIRRRPAPGRVIVNSEAVASDAMTVVARVPASALRAAATSGGSSAHPASPLTLLLRSDCATARLPIALDPPVAWLVSAGRRRGGSATISGEALHNGVRYLRFGGGPEEAVASLRALERGGGGVLAGAVRRLWEGGPPSPLPGSWPDLVVALYHHDPTGEEAETAALRALAGRTRLVPVLCMAKGEATAAAATARLYEETVGVSRLYLHGDDELEAGITLVPPGLDGIVFRELTLAGGGARL